MPPNTESIEFAIKRCGYTNLRDHQRQILEKMTEGKDCILCAPTGSGKSLIYEVAPFLFHHLKTKEECINPMNSLVIVVSPLVALMRSQTADLCQRNIRSAYLSDLLEEEDAPVMETSQTFTVEDLKSGKVNILFGSPEALLFEETKKLLKSIRGQLTCFVIDEAHCIKKL